MSEQNNNDSSHDPKTKDDKELAELRLKDTVSQLVNEHLKFWKILAGAAIAVTSTIVGVVAIVFGLSFNGIITNIESLDDEAVTLIKDLKNKVTAASAAAPTAIDIFNSNKDDFERIFNSKLPNFLSTEIPRLKLESVGQYPFGNGDLPNVNPSKNGYEADLCILTNVNESYRAATGSQCTISYSDGRWNGEADMAVCAMECFNLVYDKPN